MHLFSFQCDLYLFPSPQALCGQDEMGTGGKERQRIEYTARRTIQPQGEVVAKSRRSDVFWGFPPSSKRPTALSWIRQTWAVDCDPKAQIKFWPPISNRV